VFKIGNYGYDLFVQMDEVFINKSLAALYYSGFLKLQGTYEFIKGLSDEIKPFATVDYTLRLRNEPLIDLRETDKVYIRLNACLDVVILSGVPLSLDVDVYLETTVIYNKELSMVTFDLKKSTIADITFDRVHRVHYNLIQSMNVVLRDVIIAYLENGIYEADVPLSLYNLSLPSMPQGDQWKIPVKLGDFCIYDHRLFMIGINLFDHISGSMDNVVDLTQGSEIYVNSSVDALMDIYTLWWEHTTQRKTVNFSGHFPIKANHFIKSTSAISKKILTLGLIDEEANYDHIQANYILDIDVVDTPVFRFKENNTIEFESLKFKAMIDFNISGDVIKDVFFDTSSFIPDHLTPWDDDKLIKHTNKQVDLLHIKQSVAFNVTSARGRVTFDNVYNIVVDIIEADFTLDLGEDWYENLTEKGINLVLKFIESSLIDKIPNLIINPSFFLEKAKVMGFTMTLEGEELAFDASSMSLRCNVSVNELKESEVPVPEYIGNRIKKKLHRIHCVHALEIDVVNRVGFYVQYEAFKNGYTPCHFCLGRRDIR